MVTEMITLKLEQKFLEEIDKVVRSLHYHNRTEFIRNALREKIEQTKMKEAMLSIAHLKGAAKKNANYEEMRTKAFQEINYPNHRKQRGKFETISKRVI